MVSPAGDDIGEINCIGSMALHVPNVPYFVSRVEPVGLVDPSHHFPICTSQEAKTQEAALAPRQSTTEYAVLKIDARNENRLGIRPTTATQVRLP